MSARGYAAKTEDTFTVTEGDCEPQQQAEEKSGYDANVIGQWICAVILIIFFTILIWWAFTSLGNLGGKGKRGKGGKGKKGDGGSVGSCGMIGAFLVWLIIIIIFICAVYTCGWAAVIAFFILFIIILIIAGFASWSCGNEDGKGSVWSSDDC